MARRVAHPVHKVILNLHLLAQLPPYLLERELVVCVNEAIQPDHVEQVSVLL